jgi:DNA polymerase III epsilon subunit-like protein
MKIWKKDIIIYDIETTGLDSKIDSVIAVGIYNKTKDITEILDIKDYKDEAELLTALLKQLSHIIRQKGLLLGYNSLFFDLPFIVDRCKKYNLFRGRYDFNIFSYNKMNPASNNMDQCHMLSMNYNNLDHIDVLDVLRRYFKNFREYNLKAVCESLEIEKGKIEIDELPQVLYKSNHELFTDYLKYDLWSVAEIDDKLKIVDFLNEISNITNVPIRSCTSIIRICDSILDKYRFRGLKTLSEFFERREDGYIKFAGGFNYDPIPGFHENVIIYDFKSLYPTIMKKVEFEPKLTNCITDLLSKRDEHKSAGDNEVQAAYKIIANSLYGYFGNKYAKYGNPNISALVTFIGRVLNHRGISIFKDSNCEVLMTSTDSFAVQEKESGQAEVARKLIELQAERLFTWFKIFMRDKGVDELIDTLWYICDGDAEAFNNLWNYDFYEKYDLVYEPSDAELQDNFLEREEELDCMMLSDRIKSYIKIKGDKAKVVGFITNINKEKAILPVFEKIALNYTYDKPLKLREIIQEYLEENDNNYKLLLPIKKVNKNYTLDASGDIADCINKSGLKVINGERIYTFKGRAYRLNDKIEFNERDQAKIIRNFEKNVKQELEKFQILLDQTKFF